jgi:hypothetical protein
MRKWERDLRKMIESLDLSVDSLTQSGGDHYKIVVRHPDGRTHLTFAPLTPSDRRGLLNMRSDIRRYFAQEAPSDKADSQGRPVV